MDNAIHKLAALFREFPGIGPRQAKRFVYYLLTRSGDERREIAARITALSREIERCSSCFRFFEKRGRTGQALCAVCADANRDPALLMVVPRDIDLEAVEKSGSYGGGYFVLGGTVPILEQDPEKRVRIRELREAVKKRIKAGLKEIIVATSLNPEGENTFELVRSLLAPETGSAGVRLSGLGRGLSTGTELEYSDAETLKNALKNRQ